MEYEGQICRAPMERAAYKLPVMVGCCYNKCRFCDLFKHLKFRVIPIGEVEADIKRVYDAGGKPRKIFLGDGSAFALQTDHLLEVLDIIHRYFPECGEINMNATVSCILLKSDDELQKLAANGVKHLYIGLESGLEDVLEFMNKGNTVDQLREAVKRIRQFGMCFDAHIMTGSAGHGRSTENAQATAAVLAELEASSATNFSMFIHHETPLYNDMLEGRFDAASEYENLLEERELISVISDRLIKNGKHSMKYEGFHDFISFHVWGVLPRDMDKMQIKLDNIISEYSSKKDVKSIIDPDSKFEIKSAY
jgi:radical SAM superfamily enzyme YgiQ (UPF0313 family)